jgi:hypothetical protein
MTPERGTFPAFKRPTGLEVGRVSLREKLRSSLHRWADGNWDGGHADGNWDGTQWRAGLAEGKQSVT